MFSFHWLSILLKEIDTKREKKQPTSREPINTLQENQRRSLSEMNQI